MPKSGIINLSREGLLRKTPLKKLALLFDHLYVDLRALWMSKIDLEHEKVSVEEGNFILSEIDWLRENGVLQTYSIVKEDFPISSIDDSLIDDIQEVSG